MPDAWGERLPRTLGLFNATAVLVGVTVGSGIFRVPALVATQLHDPGPVLACWVAGGLIALCGAMSMAELAASLPRSGGVFAYLLESFGPAPAFVFGWTELTVIRASALGATATIFAEYLGYFIDLRPQQVRFVAAAAIVAIGTINYFGARRAATLMGVATVGKYAAVMALGLLAFTAGSGSGTHFLPVWGPEVHLSMMATALIPVMWTYDGWADLSFMGGEVSNPQRTLPLALVLGTVCVMLVYLIVNVGFMYLLPMQQIAGAKLIAATAAAHIPLLGGAGAGVIAVVVVVSAISGLNGSMMTGPRIFYAMAEKGLFFRAVGRVSPQFQTPSVAIWLATALGVVYVLQNDFAQLADRFILGIWPFYALAVAGIFVLRRRRPDLQRPYRVPGYPMVPLLFLLASFGLIANALVTDLRDTAVTLGIIAAGIPMYYLWKLRALRR